MTRSARALAVALVVGAAALITGCASNADKVNDNLSKEAEKFNIVRKIVGINGITDKVEFSVTGRCSLEQNGSLPNNLEVICKEDDDHYSKHFIGLSDNMTWISTQVQGVDVSEFRTKIIIKPQNIVPDFDLVTG
jgi:hypothetical protein